MTSISNVFSNADINYLLTLPEVLDAKEKVNKLGVAYFTISITESIRISLSNKFGLDL
jgi:hypothetical protein